MAEFRKHHLVSELLSLLGTSDKIRPEILLDFLNNKALTHKVQTQVAAHTAKIRVAETSSQPEKFVQLYDELKSKQVRELDPFVYILSRVAEDKSLREFLQTTCKNPAVAAPGDDDRDLNALPAEILERLPAPVRSVATATDGSSSTSGPASSSTGAAQGQAAAAVMTAEEVSALRSQLASLSRTTSADTRQRRSKQQQQQQQRGASKSADGVELPVMPDWLAARCNLTEDYPSKMGTRSAGQATGPIGNLPLRVQETAIMQDLIHVLQGVEGQYIKVETLKDRLEARSRMEAPRFRIDASLDPSLSELAGRVLPLAAHRSVVWQYVEGDGGPLSALGPVRQALCASLRREMKDVAVFVAQLEHALRTERLTVQQMLFHAQPYLAALSALAELCSRAAQGRCRGARLLSLLHEFAANTVGEVRALFGMLTTAAAAPYLAMVEKWVYRGVVDDPHGEFMVEESPSIARKRLRETYNDAYWESHYTVRKDCVPVFLDSVSDKILSAGKYLNVVRQCGRNVECPTAVRLHYAAASPRHGYVEAIDGAHTFAAQCVLRLMMDEANLKGRLRSVHRYFLLQQGDFFVHFLDLADSELRKHVDEIAAGRLETLLELALRSTLAEMDPYKDDLRVVLKQEDLVTQLSCILAVESEAARSGSNASMASLAHAVHHQRDRSDFRLSGLEAFAFDYEVQWPLSLVISRKALTKYQLLFRHLFYIRYVERQLNSCWLAAKSVKRLSMSARTQAAIGWLAPAFALRQQMLSFVQHLWDYTCIEVVEQNRAQLETALSQVTTVDQVLALHNDFLDRCLKDCMLTTPELLKIIHKLLTTCIMFTNYLHKFLRGKDLSELASVISGKPKKARKKAAEAVTSDHAGLVQSSDMEAMLSTISRNFVKYVLALLGELRKVSVDEFERCMSSMLARLDYNNYYSKQEAAQQEAAAAATQHATHQSTASLMSLSSLSLG